MVFAAASFAFARYVDNKSAPFRFVPNEKQFAMTYKEVMGARTAAQGKTYITKPKGNLQVYFEDEKRISPSFGEPLLDRALSTLDSIRVTSPELSQFSTWKQYVEDNLDTVIVSKDVPFERAAQCKRNCCYFSPLELKRSATSIALGRGSNDYFFDGYVADIGFTSTLVHEATHSMMNRNGLRADSRLGREAQAVKIEITFLSDVERKLNEARLPKGKVDSLCAKAMQLLDRIKVKQHVTAGLTYVFDEEMRSAMRNAANAAAGIFIFAAIMLAIAANSARWKQRRRATMKGTDAVE